MLLCILFCSCQSQKEYENNAIGIGLLEVNTVYPIPLFRKEKDAIPIDTLKFKHRDNGTIEFVTKINLKPYNIYEGDTHDEGQRKMELGLVSKPPQLRFRVMDSTETFFQVIANETSNESYFIKIDPERVYYKTLSQLYENNCSDRPNTNWNLFETWERYLRRVDFITKKDLKIFDQPDGQIIFENSDDDFLPFVVSDVRGGWIKLQKGFALESDTSKNYNGWTRWRIGDRVLIDIVEVAYE